MRTLFITGAEKVPANHEAEAKAIGADFFNSNFNKGGYNASAMEKILSTLKSALTLPRGYDVYFSETVFVIPALAKRLGRISRKAKIVDLVADPVLYNLNYSPKLTLFDRVHAMFIKDVDAFVMDGDWSELVKRLGIDVPTLATEPSTPDGLYRMLMGLKIEDYKDNHDIIFVGHLNKERMKYKGVDLLLEAMQMLRDKYPDMRLYVTGNSNIEHEKVVLTGFKKTDEEFVGAFKDRALSVVMGRGDSFPLATIETMQAGIPTIVSEQTGTKTIVEKADRSFVLPLDAKALAKRIDDYFSLSKKEKLELRKRFREASTPYKASAKLEEFGEAYKKFENDYLTK